MLYFITTKLLLLKNIAYDAPFYFVIVYLCIVFVFLCFIMAIDKFRPSRVAVVGVVVVMVVMLVVVVV